MPPAVLNYRTKLRLLQQQCGGRDRAHGAPVGDVQSADAKRAASSIAGQHETFSCCFEHQKVFARQFYTMKIKDDETHPRCKKMCPQKQLERLELTLSCSLWTFPCRPGKGTPESCWCLPFLRPSAHGSVTRGTRWHQTYWQSNPEGIQREQVSLVKLQPWPAPRDHWEHYQTRPTGTEVLSSCS